jgi:transcriptional antiterminator NusG
MNQLNSNQKPLIVEWLLAAMAFYAVATKSGSELSVAIAIGDGSTPHIHAALAPGQLDSYIIVEADGELPIKNAVADIPKAKKILPGKTSLAEVKSYLSPTSQVEGVETGDIVEITGGPYKGQNARVKQINKGKNQVTVELHEEKIPLPVVVSGDQFRESSNT